MDNSSIEIFYQNLRKNFQEPAFCYASQSSQLHLPKFPQEIVLYVIRTASNLLNQENSLLYLESPIVVIGDLHGHILDLIRIFQHHGDPPLKKYLVLGDMIDRGEFSIETLLLLLSIKILYPTSIYLIRGNHETHSVCSTHGFLNEIIHFYNVPYAFSSLSILFNNLPYAAVIDKRFICFHGGLSPKFLSLDQLSQIVKPHDPTTSDITISLLWSDPDDKVHDFAPSHRGIGYLFGKEPTKRFLLSNSLQGIIRSHEVAKEGYKTNFCGKCVTIFSCSNYCGVENNMSATLYIQRDNDLDISQFDPLPYLRRCNVSFLNISMDIFYKSIPIGPSPKIRKTLSCSCDQKMKEGSKKFCQIIPLAMNLSFLKKTNPQIGKYFFKFHCVFTDS